MLNVKTLLRNAAAGVALASPSLAFAQGVGNQVTSGMLNGICGFLGPFVGSNSTVLSLIFLVSLGVVIVLWYLNDSKESMMGYILRTGIALGILINLFTLPSLVGLPSICGGRF